MPVATQHTFSFDQAVEGFLRAHGQLSFLQIGGYDGVSYDPLRKHILGGRLTGVIVEPVPDHFAKLQALYAGNDTIRIENCAVDREAGERTMWFFSREAIANGTIGAVFGGITSFLLPALLEKGGSLGGMYSEQNRAILNSLVESISVPCHTYETVIAKHGLQRIDLLQIDTEGYDYELLKAFDFQRHRPALVQYECQHLSPADRAAAEAMLVGLGYVLHSTDYDTLAIRGLFLDAHTQHTAGLAQTAATLLAEGRGDLAFPLYDYLLGLAPDDLTVKMASIEAAAAAGMYPEAVARINEIAVLLRPDADVTGLARQVALAAVKTFNERLQAGDLAGAEPAIDSLAALLPGRYVQAALNVARTAGKPDKMMHYAGLALQQDPNSWLAHAALGDVAEARGDTAARLRHQAQAVLHRPRDGNGDERMFSAEAYHVISEMLTGPYDAAWPPVIAALRDAVAARPETFTAEDQRALDRHLRVSLESLDVALLEGAPETGAALRPDFTVADSAGVAIAAGELPQHVRALAPQVVFLAAADEVYLRRYGRAYLQSILGRCDTGCAVLLCMVGDPARLPDVAAEIGIRDARLFYLVDRADPAHAVSYVTRSGCLTGCARAYYQSARFLLLPHLLQALDLPMIVSDIDISLQGSVADLLQRHGAAEVVLNRNSVTVSYGSHFTANLLLLRPGETARQFAGLLRRFLAQALKRRDIEQFIDQTGLVLAHQFCQRHGLQGLGYFVADDINNVMLNRATQDSASLNDNMKSLARSFVFFAYYGSEGESAVNLMKAVGADD